MQMEGDETSTKKGVTESGTIETNSMNDGGAARFDILMNMIKSQDKKIDNLTKILECLARKLASIDHAQDEAKFYLKMIDENVQKKKCSGDFTTKNIFESSSWGILADEAKEIKSTTNSGFDDTAVITIPDDEDDSEDEGIKRTMYKGKSNVTPARKDMKMGTPASKKKGGPVGKRVTNKSGATKISISNKLFNPSNQLLKKPKVESPGKSTTTHLQPRAKNIRSWLTPTSDMGFEKMEEYTALYIFGCLLDKSENIFKFKDIFVTRDDFQSLILDKPLNQELFVLLAKKITWMQSISNRITTWCLPPCFTEDIMNNMSVEDMRSKYAAEWLNPSSNLTYVYVPICDTINNHWFLIVISFKHQKIYWFDIFRTKDVLPSRTTMINYVVAMMNKLLPRKGDFEISHDITIWPLLNVEGVPNFGDSKDSAYWVLDWLSMEESFEPFVMGRLNEDKVKLRTAINLVSSHFNQFHPKVECEATMIMNKLEE